MTGSRSSCSNAVESSSGSPKSVTILHRASGGGSDGRGDVSALLQEAYTAVQVACLRGRTALVIYSLSEVEDNA
jgi:hypothetical protein